jgi:hypothetical protein
MSETDEIYLRNDDDVCIHQTGPGPTGPDRPDPTWWPAATGRQRRGLTTTALPVASIRPTVRPFGERSMPVRQLIPLWSSALMLLVANPLDLTMRARAGSGGLNGGKSFRARSAHALSVNHDNGLIRPSTYVHRDVDDNISGPARAGPFMPRLRDNGRRKNNTVCPTDAAVVVYR